MKPTLLFLLLLSILKLNAQSTWIERINYWPLDPGYYIYHDSVCGILNAAVGVDGYLYMQGKLRMDNSEKLYKISQDGGAFLWTADVGAHYTLSSQEAGSLRATSDSGCILFINARSWANDYHISSYVKKYSPSGVLQWNHIFINTDSLPLKTAYDLIQNSSGNYYVLIADSLFELDNSGNVIFGTDAVSGPQSFYLPAGDMLYELPGGDLLVRKDSSIIRTDLSGNVAWTYSPINTTDVVSFSSSAVFVCGQGTQVTKIDAATGSASWSIPISSEPVSSTDAAADGGVIIANGMRPLGSMEVTMDATLTKFDASGNQQWSKTYPLPYYGLSYVKQLPSGYYLTGGTYRVHRPAICVKDYNGFSAVVDSAGSGLLETASLISPGDADSNSYIDFITDALFTGIAFGATGPARDHDNGPIYISYFLDYFNDYASDWSQSFGNGVNYKCADFNGDGLIDNSDLSAYCCYWTWFGMQYGPIDVDCKESDASQLNTLPDFKLIPQYSTVLPGDTMRFYIVGGSSGTPVDSLYGIASALTFNYSLIDNSYAVAQGYTGDFGTPGIDMLAYSNSDLLSSGIMTTIFSRTNHSDVSQLYDTLGVVELIANPAISVPTVFDLDIADFGACVYNTSLVDFNTISTSVLIDPTATSVEGLNTDPIIFPNPASQNLTVKTFSAGEKTFEITDVTGKKLRAYESSQMVFHISTDDLESGTYFLKIVSEGNEKVSKFMVQR